MTRSLSSESLVRRSDKIGYVYKTSRQCDPINANGTLPSPLGLSSISSSWSQANNTCYGTAMVGQCEKEGGECVTIQEGFYAMSIVWAVIGALSFVWILRTVRHLQTIPPTEWRVVNKPEKKNEDTFKYFYCF